MLIFQNRMQRGGGAIILMRHIFNTNISYQKHYDHNAHEKL